MKSAAKLSNKKRQGRVGGYTVMPIVFEGKLMNEIITPIGKTIRIERDEKLMVIDDDPKYVYKSGMALT